MTRRFISAKEYGATHGVGPRQVTIWCNRGLVSGAQKMPGRTGLWIIPEGATVLRPVKKSVDRDKTIN